MAKGKNKDMAKMVDPDEGEQKMVDPETAPEPEKKSKLKKGTLVCMRVIRDGGDTYVAGDEYKGKDKATTKHLLKRGAIEKV